MRFAVLLLLSSIFTTPAADYFIVVSERTAVDAGWKLVVETLTAKHGAVTVTWKAAPEEVLPALQKDMPRHTCFVATPAEASREFVQRIHRLTRRLDSDPYTDTRWAILTGFDSANALAIAREDKPLTIQNVGSGTEVALDRCESGTWYCELRKGHSVQKAKGGGAEERNVEPDTTKALADLLCTGGPGLWVTSGHATERDWMIGFRYRNGFWKSKAGQLFGEDTKGTRFDIHSTNPKVYLAVGNCLMGHIDGPDAMSLAWMKSAAVRQMTGYVLPTWYGYQGWGLLDYFVEQPGRYTLTEAFHANNIALVHRLLTNFPGSEKIGTVDGNGRPPRNSPPPVIAGSLTTQDLSGLLFDRDNVAFYGDPAWEARMASGKLNWRQELTTGDHGEHTLTITPLAGSATWQPVNNNGSQRGGRPVIQFLSRRIDPAKVKITAGSELQPVIADDFILVPLPEKADGPVTLRFTAG